MIGLLRKVSQLTLSRALLCQIDRQAFQQGELKRHSLTRGMSACSYETNQRTSRQYFTSVSDANLLLEDPIQPTESSEMRPATKQDSKGVISYEEEMKPCKVDDDRLLDSIETEVEQQQHSRRQFGETLIDIDFTKEQLPPFQKVMRKPKKLEARNEKACRFLQENEVQLKSIESIIPKPYLTWEQAKFPWYINEMVQQSGFQELMPIQAVTFPIILGGHDLIGIAQTGSGKTLSYVLPMLMHVNAQEVVQPGGGPIALVLTPTRELAHQIHEQCIKFSRKRKVNCFSVSGGSSKLYQEKALRKGQDILIATPGRLVDFLENKIIDLRRVTLVVLDEADRMLDMGFERLIRKILGQIRPDRQTLMFSATWPISVQMLAQDFCYSDPVHLQIGSQENMISSEIEQVVEVIDEAFKYARLKEILQSLGEGERSIVFTETRKGCEDLMQELLKDGFGNVMSLHGDKEQRERESVLSRFKRGEANILIATDIAARGIDIKAIKLVINYDFPKCIEDYVHRVGRTGRAGSKGKAISFFDLEKNMSMTRKVWQLLEYHGQSVPEKLKDLGLQKKINRQKQMINNFTRKDKYMDGDTEYDKMFIQNRQFGSGEADNNLDRHIDNVVSEGGDNNGNQNQNDDGDAVSEENYKNFIANCQKKE